MGLCVAQTGIGEPASSREMAKRSDNKVSFKMTGRGGHLGLEQTPNQATVNSDGGGRSHSWHVSEARNAHDRGKFLRHSKAASWDLAFPNQQKTSSGFEPVRAEMVEASPSRRAVRV